MKEAHRNLLTTGRQGDKDKSWILDVYLSRDARLWGDVRVGSCRRLDPMDLLPYQLVKTGVGPERKKKNSRGALFHFTRRGQLLVSPPKIRELLPTFATFLLPKHDLFLLVAIDTSSLLRSTPES